MTYSRFHVPDEVLLRDFESHLAQERGCTAVVLADLAEIDARELYLPAAYPSMLTFCVGEYGLSEDSARKRIHAARAARRFPAIFPAVAEGRLHLSGVVMLAPHLTEGNAANLLAAAAHKTKAEIKVLLAEHFPRTEVMAMVMPAPPVELNGQVTIAAQRAPGRVEGAASSVVAPLAPQRFTVQLNIGQSTHDKLRYAQELLGHQVPSGDLAEVLDRALDALIAKLEKRKFAATDRPRGQSRRTSTNPRHIPAHVRRAVHERDGGQCTFVSEGGHRCQARSPLEFDHVDPVARGGKATVEGVRLRCRAHNQYAAEQVFGKPFMEHKREEAQRAAAEAQTKKKVDDDVIKALRSLGYRMDQARQAAKICEEIPDATLEQKVKRALTQFLRPSIHKRTPGPSTATNTMAAKNPNETQAAFIGSA